MYPQQPTGTSCNQIRLCVSAVAPRGPEPCCCPCYCLAPEHSSWAVEVEEVWVYLALGPAETDVTGGAQDIRNEGGDAKTHGDRRQQRRRDI